MGSLQEPEAPEHSPQHPPFSGTVRCVQETQP